MKVGIDDALNRIAEVTVDNKRELKKSKMQRRTEFTDLYGVPFYAESDENNEANFYISVSPDLVYMMRFQFKIYIQYLGIHGSGDGDFHIYMHGHDITDYLIEQEEGDWIDGEGLFPTNAVEDETDFYDIMDVAVVMHNEGREEAANDLLKPGFKQMKITADGSFKATMYLYMKYNTVGR